MISTNTTYLREVVPPYSCTPYSCTPALFLINCWHVWLLLAMSPHPHTRVTRIQLFVQSASVSPGHRYQATPQPPYHAACHNLSLHLHRGDTIIPTASPHSTHYSQEAPCTTRWRRGDGASAGAAHKTVSTRSARTTRRCIRCRDYIIII
jgi:hypothetical protein